MNTSQYRSKYLIGDHHRQYSKYVEGQQVCELTLSEIRKFIKSHYTKDKLKDLKIYIKTNTLGIITYADIRLYKFIDYKNNHVVLDQRYIFSPYDYIIWDEEDDEIRIIPKEVFNLLYSEYDPYENSIAIKQVIEEIGDSYKVLIGKET